MLLETDSIDVRLEKILELLESELDVLKVEKKIRSRVKRQMEKTQREYYLNEQLKAIQKELGDSDDVTDDNEGVQYTILSDLFLHRPGIEQNIDQIIFRTTFSTQTLFDSVGREAENMYNMWGSQNILDSYGAFNQTTRVGAKDLMPNQFEHYLTQAEVPTSISHYITSYMKVSDEQKNINMKQKMDWTSLRLISKQMEG